MPTAVDGITLDEAELPFLDVNSREFAEDPWSAIDAARAQGKPGGMLVRSERGVELISYGPLAETLQDKRLRTLHSDYWAEHGAGPMTLDFVDHGHLLTFEPERHLRVRRKMVAAFQMTKIEEARGAFHEIGNRLVDEFAARGHCDVVGDFTHRYSIEILCRMIGVPDSDIPHFEQATLDLVGLNARPYEAAADQVEQALTTLFEYSADIVKRREREPEQDFISSMLVSRDDGSLSQHEMTWGVANLLFAGHDTTRYQLASIVRALIVTDQWQSAHEHPEWAPEIVEEGLRVFPVTLLLSRVVVSDDYVIDGVHLPAGTIVRANIMGTNRDPERFPDGARFDIHRERGRTVPFGQGIHKCIGHALARADMEVGIEILIRRLKDVRIDGGVPFQPTTGALWGPTRLPITFETVGQE